MRISVFGLGYVGAVSSGCLAALGHDVVGVDIVEDKVRRIARGESPIIEQGLNPILKEAVSQSRLRATTDAAAAVEGSDVGIICVGTPSTPSGGIDTRYLDRVCQQIGEAVRSKKTENFTVMVRSTCLPAVHRALMNVLAESSGSAIGDRIGYVCHPEFLREGSAVNDFYNPPKIVFGTADDHSRTACQDLYRGIVAEVFHTSVDVAAMVKYADNSFHALKVTFGNEIGLICKAMGIDSRALMDVFCRDLKLNISEKYLRPGNPFGGSCLPKDLRALLDASRTTAVPMPMHAGMLESNRQQVDRIVERIVAANGRHPVGLIGLAFKEGTDDVRESPMVALAEQLLGKGIPVRIYDENLTISNMIGANRNFAIEAIPHLVELLSNDLKSVVAASRTLVINHRLTTEKWDKAGLRPDQSLFDLVNVEELASESHYEGLYW